MGNSELGKTLYEVDEIFGKDLLDCSDDFEDTYEDGYVPKSEEKGFGEDVFDVIFGYEV